MTLGQVIEVITKDNLPQLNNEIDVKTKISGLSAFLGSTEVQTAADLDFDHFWAKYQETFRAVLRPYDDV